MKKVTLALSMLLALGLVSCSAYKAEKENYYQGTITSSAYQANNLKLTIRKGCDGTNSGEIIELISPYNSTFVVGACVKISNSGEIIKNVSTLVPRTPL